MDKCGLRPSQSPINDVVGQVHDHEKESKRANGDGGFACWPMDNGFELDGRDKLSMARSSRVQLPMEDQAISV